MRLYKWLRGVALLLAVLLVASSCALADHAAYVSSGSIDVYSDSDLQKKIGSLSKNAVVLVRSSSGGAAKIVYQGKGGYAAGSGLRAVDGDAVEAVVATSTRVYKKASAKGAYASVKKGTKVQLLAVSGDCAMIERNGYIGYTRRADLLTAGETAAPEKPAAPDFSDVVVETFTAAVSADSLAVYKGASTASAKLGTLKKGAEVTVSAYNDLWARLDNDGKIGYAARSGLVRGAAETPAPTPEPTPTPAPDPTPAPGGSATDVIDSGKYSNEEAIYLYLTKAMGLNTAAAAGILSNIRSESSFRPTAYNAGGGSYGICQWTGSRYTRLKSYCADKGLDYTTLSAQLRFLDYELEKYYPKVLRYMRGVDNTAAGAYDAGYYYCYHFEAPANRGSVSIKRGNAARDTYWAKYA